MDQPIERMIMGNGRTAVYDNGFYNIGVRPTREDIGLGAFIGPKNLPLSDARRWQDCVRERVGKGSSIEAANDACGVPRLRAEPEEALELLRRAAERLGSVAGVAALLEDADAALGAHRPGDAYAALVAAHALLVSADASSQAAALLSDAAGLLPDPLDPGPDPDRPYAPRLSPGERIAADGAFKTPGLRNASSSPRPASTTGARRRSGRWSSSTAAAATSGSRTWMTSIRTSCGSASRTRRRTTSSRS